MDMNKYEWNKYLKGMIIDRYLLFKHRQVSEERKRKQSKYKLNNKFSHDITIFIRTFASVPYYFRSFFPIYLMPKVKDAKITRDFFILFHRINF